MISALVLAAGLSRRMGANLLGTNLLGTNLLGTNLLGTNLLGTNKLLLPFRGRTILAQVVAVLRECPLDEIVVVTGHERERIQEMLTRDPLPGSALRFVHNPNYAAGEMLSSIQAGLAALRDDCQAALIALGDQPHVERRVVERVIAAHEPGKVIVPSFERRSGHPILMDRACWPEALALPVGSSLRELLRAHADWVRYVEVDTASVLRDVDTPEDWLNADR